MTNKILDSTEYPFWQTPNALIDDGHMAAMGVSTFAVYMTLKRHANSSKQCFPSYTKLQGETGLSRGSITKAINYLTEFGYIRKLNVGSFHKNSTLYEILDLRLVARSPNALGHRIAQSTTVPTTVPTRLPDELVYSVAQSTTVPTRLPDELSLGHQIAHKNTNLKILNDLLIDQETVSNISGMETLGSITSEIKRSLDETYKIEDKRSTEENLEINQEKPRDQEMTTPKPILKTEKEKPHLQSSNKCDGETLPAEDADFHNFIIETRKAEGVEIGNRWAYLNTILSNPEDLAKWRSRYNESLKPNIPPKARRDSFSIVSTAINEMWERNPQSAINKFNEYPEYQQQILEQYPFAVETLTGKKNDINPEIAFINKRISRLQTTLNSMPLNKQQRLERELEIKELKRQTELIAA
jgi:hypothetical protein